VTKIEAIAACCGLASVFSISACRREERRFSEPPAASRLNRDNRMDNATTGHANLVRYSEDAWAVSEGQRLFQQMNCAGCHFHGGGGMGPPLMDAKWRYGSELEDIARSIVSGRPNGMPAFGSRLSDQQVWQIAAYVRSLSGRARSDVAPVRDDHMAVRPPPSRTKPEPPVLKAD
jgi:cytochrome c oxidase cbb3-type subunit 3